MIAQRLRVEGAFISRTSRGNLRVAVSVIQISAGVAEQYSLNSRSSYVAQMFSE